MAGIESVDEFVIHTLAAVCNFEPTAITPETTLSALGMDSLRLTAVVAHVEGMYECELTPDDVVDLLLAPLVADVVAKVRGIAGRAES